MMQTGELSPPFSFKARYVQGNRKGQIFFKPKCRWHLSQKHRDDQNKPKKSKEAGMAKANSNFDKDQLVLFDLIEDRPFYVRRWLIIEFNGKKVIHE